MDSEMIEVEGKWDDAKIFIDNFSHAHRQGMAFEFFITFMESVRNGNTTKDAVAFAIREWDL